MYERHDILALIKMVEKGNLRLKEEDGCYVVGEFGLDQWRHWRRLISSLELEKAWCFLFRYNLKDTCIQGS